MKVQVWGDEHEPHDDTVVFNGVQYTGDDFTSMPTYEYLCDECGHRFEVFQHIADAPLTTCPNCSGHIHRVLFPAGIVFKGGGFYKTDSRGTSSASNPAPVTHEADSATASSNGSEKASAKSETKTESTSTTKTESAPSSSSSTSN